MGMLKVNSGELSRISDELKCEKRNFSEQYQRFLQIEKELKAISNYNGVADSLSSIEKRLCEEVEQMELLYLKLKDINENYSSCEKKILSQKIACETIKAIQKEAAAVISDEKFLNYIERLRKELDIFPPRLGKIKDILWGMWATDTGNQIEKDFFLAIEATISKFLAFEYNESEDYYFTDENYGIQRRAGFMDLFDDLGGLLGMDLDTEVLIFTPKGSDKEYRLQFWKGSYGWEGAYGGEIGLYSRDTDAAKSNPYVEGDSSSKFIRYDCVSGSDEMETKQDIYSKDGTLLFSNSTEDYAEDGDHFWNLAIKTDPGYEAEDLVIKEYLVVEDEAMQDAIIEACNDNPNLEYVPTESSDREICIQYGKFAD